MDVQYNNAQTESNLPAASLFASFAAAAAAAAQSGDAAKTRATSEPTKHEWVPLGSYLPAGSDSFLVH